MSSIHVCYDYNTLRSLIIARAVGPEERGGREGWKGRGRRVDVVGWNTHY